MTLASTAIPTESISAAIPGRVSVAPSEEYINININIYAKSAISAISPGIL